MFYNQPGLETLKPFRFALEEAHINLISSLQLTEFYIVSSSAFELCHSVFHSSVKHFVSYFNH